MNIENKIVTICDSARFWDKIQAVSEEIAYARVSGKEVVYLEEKITMCGDNCLECPRYNAHTEEELRHVAELWHRVGWRDRIVSNEEIACTGCSKHKKCTYQLVECAQKHHVSKCVQCEGFPCDKIRDMLKRSSEYQKVCKEVCTEEDYRMLKRAFFEKEQNLQRIKEK